MIEIHYGLTQSDHDFIRKIITIGKGNVNTGKKQLNNITIIEKYTNKNNGEVVFAKMLGAYDWPFIWKNKIKKEKKL